MGGCLSYESWELLLKEYSCISFHFYRGPVLEWELTLPLTDGKYWNEDAPPEYQIFYIRKRVSRKRSRCFFRPGAFNCEHSRTDLTTGGALQLKPLPRHWPTMEDLVDTANNLHTNQTCNVMEGKVPDWALDEVRARQELWRRSWKALLRRWCSKANEQDQQYAVAVFNICGMPCADVVAHNTHRIFENDLLTAFTCLQEQPCTFRFDFSDIAQLDRQILHARRAGASLAEEKLFFSLLLAATDAQLTNLSRLGSAAFVFQQVRGERNGHESLQTLAKNGHRQAYELQAQLQTQRQAQRQAQLEEEHLALEQQAVHPPAREVLLWEDSVTDKNSNSMDLEESDITTGGLSFLAGNSMALEESVRTTWDFPLDSPHGARVDEGIGLLSGGVPLMLENRAIGHGEDGEYVGLRRQEEQLLAQLRVVWGRMGRYGAQRHKLSQAAFISLNSRHPAAVPAGAAPADHWFARLRDTQVNYAPAIDIFDVGISQPTTPTNDPTFMEVSDDEDIGSPNVETPNLVDMMLSMWGS